MDNQIAFVHDDEIHDAQAKMINAIDTMFDHKETAGTYKVKKATKYFLSAILSVDPAKIAADFDRSYHIADDIGGEAKAVGQLDLTRDHLVAWKGLAADAFRLQITYMKEFCENEKELMFEARRGVAAALAAAVLSRESYRNLLEATTAAAINVHEERKSKDTEAKVAIVGNIAEAILGLNPANLHGTAAEFVVGLGKDLTPIYLDDSGAEQVCEDFWRQGQRLGTQLQDTYNNVRQEFTKLRDKAADGRAELFAPLPVYCDVGSPDFTYEHFQNTIHDPGPIGPQVEAERTKYLAEKQHGGEIERRLHPKGEI